MKTSQLIAMLQEYLDACGDLDVYVVDHPSEIGVMDAGCPPSKVSADDDAIYVCMCDWG